MLLRLTVTIEEVKQLPAGQVLDCLAAELVMGWTKAGDKFYGENCVLYNDKEANAFEVSPDGNYPLLSKGAFNPSRILKDAFVMETEMYHRGKFFAINRYQDGKFVAVFDSYTYVNKGIYGEGSTVELAITKASIIWVLWCNNNRGR